MTERKYVLKICRKRDLGENSCIGCEALDKCRKFIVEHKIPYDEAIAYTARQYCPEGFSPQGSEIVENHIAVGVNLEGEIIPKTIK